MTHYTDTIRRWATDTRRCGSLSDADGTGEVGLGAGEAGRRLAVRFAPRVKEGAVEEIRFQVFGCGFTIAACAAAAELAEGHSLEEVRAITPAWVDALLEGLPSERSYCAELAVEALQAAVAGALGGTSAVQATLHPPGDEGPRGSAEDATYRALMACATPGHIPPEDRHLFACALAAGAREPWGTAAALGLSGGELSALVRTCFPGVDPSLLPSTGPRAHKRPPEPNDDVRALILSHVPRDEGGVEIPASGWLARILAARSAHPGHLWSAMGLFERPELSAAIRRLLPSLAAANHKGMRWKRFLFKQVCELQGSVLCKSPDCGLCSDYALCFAPETDGSP